MSTTATPLTAEMIARGVIAAAVSYGDDPAHALEIQRGENRRCLAPAIEGICDATRQQLGVVASCVGFGSSNVARARSAGGQRYTKAQEAAREAVTYHLRTLELAARADRPKPARMAAPRPERRVQPRRQIARSATVENLGGGVQVIRVKPVTDSIVRHSAAQVKRGVPLDVLAELFEVDPDSLKRALNAAGVEVAA